MVQIALQHPAHGGVIGLRRERALGDLSVQLIGATAREFVVAAVGGCAGWVNIKKLIHQIRFDFAGMKWVETGVGLVGAGGLLCVDDEFIE